MNNRYLMTKLTDDCKYDEQLILNDIIGYINSTYTGHYVGKNDVQVVDIWKSLGSIESTARDTAIKYLMRFGKKEGKNKKDLLKAIHYIMMLIHFSNDGDDNETSV